MMRWLGAPRGGARSLAALLLLLTSLVVVGDVSARAISTKVHVVFSHSVVYQRDGIGSPVDRECSLRVPVGSNAIVVLKTAVARGCVTSFSTKRDADGAVRLVCVDQECEVDASTDPIAPYTGGYGTAGGPITSWNVYVNGKFVYGTIDLRRIHASPGELIEFSYNYLFLLD